MSAAMIGQFILSLSILIVLHECGHFFPARWFNTRVEKFYLFFDPWFEIFKKKIGDTEYGIGWLPLGGYVKISGMVDESMDLEQMKQPPQPWEFRSKPAWQRLIIMIGGVTVNFILGFLIYGIMHWHYGEEYVPAANAKFGIYADSLGQLVGLQTGDKILSIGTKPFDKFEPNAVLRGVVLDGSRTIDLERNGQRMTLTLPTDIAQTLTKFENKDKSLFGLPIPFKIASVQGGSPAAKAGLQIGDRIIQFNDVKTPFYNDFEVMKSKTKGQPVTWRVVRSADTLTLNVQTDESGFFGFSRESNLSEIYKTEKIQYSLLEAMPKGVKTGMSFLGAQFTAFGKMFSGEIKAKDSVGGIKTIAQSYGTDWNWQRFWERTAMLSLILAFMNLLPIPALDGGYVMFLLWEVITGRRVSDKFMEKAVTVGFFLLMSLMLVIYVWDFIR
jgi:regulator of sigma E protease